MEYDNTNSGILGKNERKTTEKHPDYTGNLDVDGKGYWISGWKRAKKDGSGHILSLKITAKDAMPKKEELPAAEFDGDIDF